jgi:F420H(2)-dependent quinone reductase
MTEYRPLAERRLRDKALHAFVRTSFGRKLFTGPLAHLDRWVMERSRGRFQLAIGSPVCLLRVHGAKTGRLRIVPVLYTPRGDQLIVVASKGGAPEHPAWYHNMRSRPEIEVEIRGDRRRMRARELGGDERVETWDYINDHFAGYALYQGAVTRRIPVMVLEPRE